MALWHGGEFGGCGRDDKQYSRRYNWTAIADSAIILLTPLTL